MIAEAPKQDGHGDALDGMGGSDGMDTVGETREPLGDTTQLTSHEVINTMSSPITNCVSCERPLEASEITDYGERATINCSCCGSFTFTGTVFRMLEGRQLDTYQRAAFMHRMRTASMSKKFVLDSKILKVWLEDLRLPSPFEQVENLVLWLSQHLKAAGERIDLACEAHQAVVGAADAAGFSWVLHQAESHGWLEGTFADYLDGTAQLIGATLTLSGWKLADELLKTGRPSRLAFIAMQFGDTQLETFLREHLVPAVQSTGFQLRALNQEQPAGLIDDQLRVAIRRARFVLVDLSHGNRGAYWEAGFAEGLGKPVIYLCREDVFSTADHKDKPHFDTNHLVTIIWNSVDMPSAASRLAACIRATLPNEAIMEAE